MSAIYLFKNFGQNQSIYPYLLLSFFFGLSFVVSTTGGDSERYAEQLYNYHQQGTSLNEVLYSFYSEEDAELDIYEPFVTWFVSLFTNNAKILFAFFAVVFGYFWFKSLLIIRSHLQIPLIGLVLLVFLLLALTNPIWLINGVRMWTAVGVFFYGLLLLHLQKDKKGWVYLVLPMFIHFSLFIAPIVYLLYRIVPYKNKAHLFFALYLFTYFLGELNLDMIRGYFEVAPELLEQKGGFLSEDYVEVVQSKREKLATHVILIRTLSKYSLFVITTMAYYYYSKYKRRLNDSHFYTIFILGLIFASFSNLAANVPSGVRFAVLSNLIILTAFLLLLNYKFIKVHKVIRISLSVSLLVVIVFRIREGLEYMGPFLFIGNPIINWFIEDVPLINAIKSVL